MSSTGTATMLMPVIIAASPRYAPGDRASTSGAVPDPARLAGAASGHPGQAAKQVRCVAGWLSEAAHCDCGEDCLCPPYAADTTNARRRSACWGELIGE